MLIEFDDSCMEIFDNNTEYKTFFNKLSYEIFENKNYYYLSKKMLEFLFKNDKLDDEPKQKYKRLFEKSFEDKLILKSVNRKLKIVANTDFSEDIKRNDAEYIMTLDTFIKIGIPNKMNIIAENFSDCKFYRYMGNAYRIKEKIKSVKIELELIHAGGSTIYEAYTEKMKERKISILFIDTDKKYKSCNPGETLRKLINEITKLKNKNELKEYIELQILDVHEAENLIPITMMKKILASRNALNQKKKTFDFFDQCINANKIEALKYFDLKNGIEIGKLNDKQYKVYWKSKIEEVGETFDENNLLKGVKKDLLVQALKYLGDNIENEKFWEENIDTYMETEWNNLGQIVYSYGCARERNVC